MLTTRGCPYTCNWCSKPLYGARYAQRSPAGVAAEMAALRRQVAPDHVWFADDVFGLTPHWIEAFAREVVATGARIPFTLQSRPDLMTPAACTALAAAGAEEVWMGVESGSDEVLDAMAKGCSVDAARTATRELHRAGIRPAWFLQLGYPGERWPEILATRDLIRDEAPADVGVSVAYPLPGTRFYEQVRAQLGVKTNWEDSDDLAMLFAGAYTTELYREVRDLLPAEARVANASAARVRSTRRRELDRRWDELASRAPGMCAPGRDGAVGRP
jgi:anaerobic magnesium-protoporphyrin IX monomethyl ester cyclase